MIPTGFSRIDNSQYCQHGILHAAVGGAIPSMKPGGDTTTKVAHENGVTAAAKFAVGTKPKVEHERGAPP